MLARSIDNDVFELLGISEPAHDAQRDLVVLLRIRRRRSKLSGRDLDVLLRKRIGHVQRGQLPRGQLVRVQPDAHRILALAEDDHIAHAGHAL